MREVVSILLQCEAPHVSMRDADKTAALIEQDVALQQSLRTFSETVFSQRMPLEMGFRVMKSEMWTWCAFHLEEACQDLVSGYHCYFDTLRASRNAERLFQLWKLQNGVEENFVQDTKGSVMAPSPPSTISGSMKLSDWYFTGCATQDAQARCRKALSKFVLHECHNATNMVHLFDREALFKEVVSIVIVANPSTAPTSSNSYTHDSMCTHRHSSSPSSSSSKAKQASLDLYRNLLESHLMTVLTTSFAKPSFFSWGSFSQTSADEKRIVGLQLRRFAANCLHETSLHPMLNIYVGAVFQNASEAMQGFVERLQRCDFSITLDMCAFDVFGNVAWLTEVRQSFVQAVMSVGPTPAISTWVERLEAAIQNPLLLIRPSVQKLLLLELTNAVKNVSKTLGDLLVDRVIAAAQKELSATELSPSPQLAAWWSTVRQGICMEAFESQYIRRLLHRCARFQVHYPCEVAFAALFFSPQVVPLVFRHRIEKTLKDLTLSYQLHTAAQDLFSNDTEAEVPPPDAIFVVSHEVAVESLNQVQLRLIPRALSAPLSLLELAYDSFSMPRRTLNWIPYRSSVECVSTVSGKTYVMTFAHVCVMEAAERLCMQIQASSADTLAAPFFSTSDIVCELPVVGEVYVQLLLDDLVDACALQQNDGGLLTLGDKRDSGDRQRLDIVACSAARATKLREKHHEQTRRALECAIVRCFKSGVVLPNNASMIFEKLALPSSSNSSLSLVTDENEVHRAISRLLTKQYLQLDPSTNTISYLA